MFMNLLLVLVVFFSFLVLSGSSTILVLFSLLGVYVLLSFLFISLGLDFLGSLLLIMYVSAVGILFIFVIMLVSDKHSIYYISIFWNILLLMLIFFILFMSVESIIEINQSLLMWEDLSILDSLGRLLYNSYLFEVLVVGILCLLVVLSLYISYEGVSIF